MLKTKVIPLEFMVIEKKKKKKRICKMLKLNKLYNLEQRN